MFLPWLLSRSCFSLSKSARMNVDKGLPQQGCHFRLHAIGHLLYQHWQLPLLLDLQHSAVVKQPSESFVWFSYRARAGREVMQDLAPFCSTGSNCFRFFRSNSFFSSSSSSLSHSSSCFRFRRLSSFCRLYN